MVGDCPADESRQTPKQEVSSLDPDSKDGRHEVE